MTIAEIKKLPRRTKLKFLSKRIAIMDPASKSIARRLYPQKWWNQYSDKTINEMCLDYSEALSDFLANPEPQQFFITTDPTAEGDNILKMKARSREEVEDYCRQNQIKYHEIIPKKGHHICKYCFGNIVEGEYADLLCGDCRMLFGHSLYSEL